MLSPFLPLTRAIPHYVRRTSSIHAGFSIDIVESELPGQIGLNLNPKDRPASLSH